MFFIFLLFFFFFLIFFFFFFFFNDTATTEIYTLSLHDALPIRLNHPSASCFRCRAREDPPARLCPPPRLRPEGTRTRAAALRRRAGAACETSRGSRRPGAFGAWR